MDLKIASKRIQTILWPILTRWLLKNSQISFQDIFKHHFLDIFKHLDWIILPLRIIQYIDCNIIVDYHDNETHWYHLQLFHRMVKPHWNNSANSRYQSMTLSRIPPNTRDQSCFVKILWSTLTLISFNWDIKNGKTFFHG